MMMIAPVTLTGGVWNLYVTFNVVVLDEALVFPLLTSTLSTSVEVAMRFEHSRNG